MARSLRVAVEYIPQVKSALPLNGYPSQKAFATDVGVSVSTVKNFLSGKPVDYLYFVEISEKLGLDWQEIAYKELEAQPNHNLAIEETSPFLSGSPITHPRYFFGRQKQLKRLFNLLKRHPLQNAAIIGKGRIGKTSLLHYLKNITTTPVEELRPGQKYDWLPKPEIYKWIFVDFQDPRMASRERFLSYILENLGMKVPESCDLDNFMDVVSDNLHNPTVILLDEIGVGLQRCPELDDEFWESLRSLATNQTGGNLAFILATHESPIELAHHTGHSSPFFNIFGYTAYLGALSEKEARKLITSSPISFADEDVEWILEKSQCLPLFLQILCRECLFNLEDGETDNWREEGLRQIEPFAHLLSE
ncbi:MAG: ATP-binding protein [Nostocaceae cyanobacterium]|nr:ATP-binding protein [Nostocaceae cyanobacterium]